MYSTTLQVKIKHPSLYSTIINAYKVIKFNYTTLSIEVEEELVKDIIADYNIYLSNKRMEKEEVNNG
jgi:hypothetical protein